MAVAKKQRKAKSKEELLALAKENGIELTEESAKAYYDTMHQSGELSDEELARRRTEMPIKRKENLKGYLKRYAAMVSSADKGALINK